MAVYGNSRPPFVDDNGNPIAGGKLYIGLPDQDPVANPQAITDLNDVPISNPITLTDEGVPTTPFKINAEFSQAVYDKNGVEVPAYQTSRASGFLLYSELTGLAGQGGDWNILTTYGKGNFVRGTDNNYYISLTDGNLGNDPVSVSTSWSEFAWPTIYNPNEIYNQGDTCVGSDGDIHQSNVNGTIGQDPVTTPANWKPPVIPHGTSMLFMQASAPTGWTLDVTHNNKALRIVNTAGGTSGGSVPFSTVFASNRTTTNNATGLTVNSHPISIAEMPLHDHPGSTTTNVYATNVAGAGLDLSGPAVNATVNGVNVAAQGGSQPHPHGVTDPTHSHTSDLNVQYVDSIICTRD